MCKIDLLTSPRINLLGAYVYCMIVQHVQLYRFGSKVFTIILKANDFVLSSSSKVPLYRYVKCLYLN